MATSTIGDIHNGEHFSGFTSQLGNASRKMFGLPTPPGPKMIMDFWLYLGIVAQCATSTLATPLPAELESASNDVASRTADQGASYLVQDIPPLISLIPSTARTPNSANLSANYHVPGTEITLHITTFTHPMPAASLKRVILQGIARVEAHLDLYGDGWLSTEDEPYTISIPGCVFFAKSNSIPVHARQQHLTYGIVNSVLAGLWQWMIIGNRLDVVTFDIEDATWGVVGMGVVAPY